MTKDRVVVAMSGGVDSSVAALLLREQGYDTVGVTMKLYDAGGEDVPDYYRGCCTVDDVEDARRVCHRLGMPHYVFNLQREFRAFVIDYFCTEYRRGRTPHPCIACNDRIKFSFLLERARFLGAKYVATGHYARIRAREHTLGLLKGADTNKDQSYVLYGMGQRELRHTLLPVGWYPKDEIRRMAREAGFPNAAKPDSQDICFIPGGDYREFLRQRVTPRPGRVVDSHGAVLGEHPGVEFFTVGQRRGLGIAGARPMYVLSVDAAEAVVTVGPEEELYSAECWVEEASYVSGREPVDGAEIGVKIRYKSPEVPGTIHPRGSGALVRFRETQRAVTPGQAAVFYEGDEVLGGGRIGDSLRAPRSRPEDGGPGVVVA